jgi:hypothetical protein
MELLGQEDKTEVWSEYSQVYFSLNSMFSSIQEKVLTANTMDAYYFYQEFGKHIEKYQSKMVEVKKGGTRYYIDEILREFYRIFFDKIGNSPNRYNVWEMYFPTDWKITAEGVLADNGRIRMLTLIEFLRWAESRLSSSKKEEFDASLTDLSENLFQETDPMLWSEVLTFVCSLSPFYLENRVKYILEKPKIFGFGGRPRMFSGTGNIDKEKFEEDFTKYREEQDKAEKSKTIQLTFAISKVINTFRHIFTKENLINFIKEAESLKTQFQNDPVKNNRRERLLDFFQVLLFLFEAEK